MFRSALGAAKSAWQVSFAWELPSQRMESLRGGVLAEALEQRGEDLLVSLGSCLSAWNRWKLEGGVMAEALGQMG